MNLKKPSILIADDEPILRELLNEYLEGMGYNTVKASDGVEAWSILKESKYQFDAIILDRAMPNMDGLDVLKKIKAEPKLNKIPVIMQTGSAQQHEILEGLQAGCYYYLTKPFKQEIFVSIVKTAVSDYLNYCSVQESLKKQSGGLELLGSGEFSFRTMDESRALTSLLAAACPEPDVVAIGLSELLINAVEHGNLSISYAEKSQLLKKQNWEEEVKHRLSQKKYMNRKVFVKFKRNEKEITIHIQDQGNGFEWKQYLELNPERSGDSHGRGIAMANMLSFDNLEYIGSGNQVKVTLNI